MAKQLNISMGSVFLGLACCLVTLLAGSASNSRGADKPSFGGSWSFNQDQSDDASQKVHEAQRTTTSTRGRSGSGSPDDGYPGGGYPGGGYPGGGGMGVPGGRGGIWPGPMGGGGMGRNPIGRGPGSGAPRNEGIAGADLEPLEANPKMLKIEQNEDQLSITDETGHAKTLYPDGKKHKEQDSGGVTIAFKTHWDGERLVAESKMGHSGKLTETYELSPDSKHLYVTSRFESSHLTSPLTIRRVFDRGTASLQ